MRLFVERARALDPSFAAGVPGDGGGTVAPADRGPDAQHAGDGGRDAVVAEVCARLDGIPLAIELASARCAVLGLDGVRAGLTDRLRLLAVRRPDDRHRSLRNVLDWSHDLLGEAERTVLRRLAVFAGDVTAADAAGVVGEGIGEAAAVDAIGQLTAKSLLVRSDTGGASVFRLLETVHEYALERLDASGEGDAVRATPPGLGAGHRHGHRGAPRSRRRLAAALRRRGRRPAPGPGVGGQHPRVGGRCPRPGPRTRPPRLRPPVPGRGPGPLRAGRGAGRRRPGRRPRPERRRLGRLRPHAGRPGLPPPPPGGRAGPAPRPGDRRHRAGRRGHARAGGARPSSDDAPPDDELDRLVAEAQRLDPGTDGAVSAHVLVAGAWAIAQCPTAIDLGPATGGPGADAGPDHGPRIPDADGDRGRAVGGAGPGAEAVAAARAIGDLTLLSCALDAETSALLGLGRADAAFRLAGGRLEMLDRMPRHDPHTGGEVIDAFHMAADTALTAGRSRQALDAAAAMRRDEVAATAPHAANRETVIAFALMGRFDDAISDAEAMRADWERAGRPSAGWMTPAAAAAQLSYALLGDAARAADWKAVTQEVAGTNRHSWAKKAFVAFADARVALHEGRIDHAVRATAGWDPAPPNGYVAFVVALDAELAALTGAADAADRLATAHRMVDENAWARACLLRGEARLSGDDVALRGALDLFDEVEARFEWAVTALLAGGTTADEGRAVLRGPRGDPARLTALVGCDDWG